MSRNEEFNHLEERYSRLEREMKEIREEIDRLKGTNEESPVQTESASADREKRETPPTVRKERKKPSLTERWLENPELFIGGNLLGKLGILALILTTAWFIKFAIDRQWLNESARILVGEGFGFGAAFLALRLARQRFPIFPPVIMGGAIAILYFAIW